MRRVALTSCTCLRCGESWHPRNPEVLRCPNPKCRSPYWDRQKGSRPSTALKDAEDDYTPSELVKKIRGVR